MSRLMSRAPFNRPSVFDVLPSRPVPLSPPETEMEAASAPPQPQTQPQPQDETYSETQQGQAESPASRFRRVAYTNSGLSLRDPRPIQRQSKWLIMVSPPASLTHEPPMLGHTLSSAPAGRFSSGILMPLFPTLYAQLTAIAREFNMPSTTGVCIYLQLSEGGASMVTPRISDDSWQVLWGHFFLGDERTAPLPPHGLPICGRVEFDIDLRRARWYDSWMGYSRRVESEVMSREPSIAPTHWRGDSRTSLFPTELGAEESLTPPDVNPPTTAISSRTATHRNLPRALLLEKRDTVSVRSSRHQSRAPSISYESPSPETPQQAAVVPPAEPAFVPKALSPVAQEQEEPLTPKKTDLNTLVRQWRQSSSVTGAPSNALAAAGQPSLDPVNMPSGANVDLELDLDDFAWSISSAGPPSESPISPAWSEPSPSVHLLGRLQGSVCLTPTTCTSFGPLNYDWPDSPVSCVSRRPSPDLGIRMLEYVPLTPTTATSWGPDDLPSPIQSEYEYDSRAPSVDLGVRGMGSRPVTPSTATSWGPANSPMLVPTTPVYTRTPDAGERAFPDLGLRTRAARALVFPYYSSWETEPWEHVWPYQAHRHPKSEPIALSTPVHRVRSKVLLPQWPDFASLYPSDPSVERAAANKSQPVELPQPTAYPFLELYPVAYSYNLEQIYPTVFEVKGGNIPVPVPDAPKTRSPPEWPDFTSLYPSDPWVERAAMNKSQPAALPGSVLNYPFIELYPPVYPYNLERIYSTALRSLSGDAPAPVCNVPEKGSLPEWPDFISLYSSDPRAERAAANKSQPVALPGSVLNYPFIELYPVAYPHNLEQIYPTALEIYSGDVLTPAPNMLKNGTLPEWPDFTSLYPSDPKEERAAANKSQPVALQGSVLEYPFIELYPATYPYDLEQIYPSVPIRSRGVLEDHNRNTSASSERLLLKSPVHKPQSIILQRPVGYPFFTLYAPAYPYNLEEIYPAVHPIPSESSSTRHSAQPNSHTRVHRQRLPEFPDFAGLYPPNPSTERVADNKSQSVVLPAAGYPFLSIYSPVYPWNLAEIYGPAPLLEIPGEAVGAHKALSVRLPGYSGYPAFNLYPAPSGYPTFEMYPPVQLPPSPAMTIPIPSVKLIAAYPAIELYEPVYPHLVIYPSIQLDVAELPPRLINPRKRALTPAPSRHRSRSQRSSFTTVQGQDELRRLSRSPVQKDLATPPLPKSPARVFEMPEQPASVARKPRRTHLDLHRAVFGADTNPTSTEESPSAQPSRPRSKPKRTHDELHQIVFGGRIAEDSRGLNDIVPELPARSLPSTNSRQRSRSGTVSQRPSLPSAPAVNARASQVVPPPPSGPRARRPSVSTGFMSPRPAKSSSPSGMPPADPLPPLPNTPSPIRIRTRSPTVLGRPSPTPVPSGTILSRVRSMNTPVRPDPSAPLPAAEARGLDRSRSMSDAPSSTGTKRQSIVSERAKMFTVSENGPDVSNVFTDFPSSPKGRLVSKLDRSKLPFA